jgi:hypothetical protein
MNGKLRLILNELARPSAQKADWFAWAAAQLAHAMIGVALAGALAFLLPDALAFAIAAYGYALMKELPDYLRAPDWAAARDCIQDAAFVAAGAALAVAISRADALLFGLVLAAGVAGLAAGVWVRLPPQDGEK